MPRRHAAPGRRHRARAPAIRPRSRCTAGTIPGQRFVHDRRSTSRAKSQRARQRQPDQHDRRRRPDDHRGRDQSGDHRQHQRADRRAGHQGIRADAGRAERRIQSDDHRHELQRNRALADHLHRHSAGDRYRDGGAGQQLRRHDLDRAGAASAAALYRVHADRRQPRRRRRSRRRIDDLHGHGSGHGERHRRQYDRRRQLWRRGDRRGERDADGQRDHRQQVVHDPGAADRIDDDDDHAQQSDRCRCDDHVAARRSYDDGRWLHRASRVRRRAAPAA